MARLLALSWAPWPLQRANAGQASPDTAADLNKERRYRADAEVLILSIPILHRQGVGGGSALWREWRESAGLMRRLEFTGYSNPERAAGLNRLGFVRETSCRRESDVHESSYFGVMTASPEDSAEEAHKALGSTATEAMYTAIEGRMAEGQVETASAHFTGPARLSPSRRSELIVRAEQALATAPRKPPEFRVDGAMRLPFLHVLAEALRHPERGQSEYVYAGRLYQLWVRHAPDTRATVYFQKRGMLRAGAGVARVDGKVMRAAGGKETEFRLWFEEGAAQPVPLRIDFRAKAYLRLVFEAEG